MLSMLRLFGVCNPESYCTRCSGFATLNYKAKTVASGLQIRKSGGCFRIANPKEQRCKNSYFRYFRIANPEERSKEIQKR